MIDKFTNSVQFLKDFLKSGKHVPHWLILLFDLIIVSWAFSASYFLVTILGLQVFDAHQFFKYLLTYVVIAFLVEYFLKIHTCLLRYSNAKDLLRIILSSFSVSVLFLIFFLIVALPVALENIMPLVLNAFPAFFVSSTLLILFRLTAKYSFYLLDKTYSSQDTLNVLVFGSDNDSILLKQALENNRQIRYKVVGFIDVDRIRMNSIIEQKRVYHFKDLPFLSKSKQIDELIIIRQHLGEEAKRVVMERCIRQGIRVETVPPVSEWIAGGFNIKQIKSLKIEDLLQRKPIKIDSHNVGRDLKGKRILVTGAAGSIGSELVRQILSFEPKMVLLCDQAETPLHKLTLDLESEFPTAAIVPFLADITNKPRVENLFKEFNPQIVYHAAAYKHVPLMEHNPFEAIEVNVKGTKIVADLSVLYRVEKFVMISTDKAVNPTNVMGASKLIAEIYIQSYGSASGKYPKFITTRFGNVLGSNGSVIPRFRDQIEKGGPLTVTHPEITRYFMTIPEATQLVLEAGTMGNGGEIFVFDMGKPVKIVDLAKRMIQLSNAGKGKPIEIVFTGLRPGEKLYEELLAHAETSLPTHHAKINIAKVRTHCFKTTQQSIKELLEINLMQDKMALVRKMKEIAPEFISENSIFSVLDVQSKKELICHDIQSSNLF